jgi:3-oxoacyl-[acyl-carrier protein] reductase
MTGALAGRVALVTGASRGIGRAVAQSLARAGAEVVLTSRSLAAAEAAAEEIRGQGGRARGVEFDVADAAATERAVAALLEEYGTIPILVNNAGVTRDGLLLRMGTEDWDLVVQTNLGGTYRLCRALVASMIRKRFGRIVNVTSVVAQSGNPGQANYAAAKAGIEGFTRSLAREVATRNVTVNCVAPGFIDTEMTRGLDDRVRAKLLDQVPMNRLGQPEDVAHAVSFLVSDGASYVTGITLHVNGGMYM